MITALSPDGMAIQVHTSARGVAGFFFPCHALCLVGVLQEGPAKISQMRLFVERYLGNEYLVFGGLGENEQQQLYFLVKENGPLKQPRVVASAMRWLNQPWTFDVDGNLILQVRLLRLSDAGLCHCLKAWLAALPGIHVSAHTLDPGR